MIPVLNEVDQLPDCLKAASGEGVECIVVDGGSSDRSAEVARECGAVVVESARGRGTQLRAGAKNATGAALLFLHADARLTDGYVERVESALADADVAIGAFQLQIDGTGRGLRVLEWGVRQRCRYLGLPYGDQALFVRASDYRELGGFRPLPAMEDFEFVRRAKRRGRVAMLEDSVRISPRAWRSRGIVRMTAINLVSACAYQFGVSAERIAKWRRSGPVCD